MFQTENRKTTPERDDGAIHGRSVLEKAQIAFARVRAPRPSVWEDPKFPPGKTVPNVVMPRACPSSVAAAAAAAAAAAGRAKVH